MKQITFHKRLPNLHFVKLLAIFVCASLFLSACGEKATVPKVGLGVPYQVHERLVINVLSYKLTSSNKEIPFADPPPANKKYLAVRILMSNPGKNRGVKDSCLPEIMEQVDLQNPKLGPKPFKMTFDNIFPSLETFKPGSRGISYDPIHAGQSKDGWILATIPNDVYQPITLTFTPKKNIGPSRSMAVDLI
jgi:hypothetical protein